MRKLLLTAFLLAFSYNAFSQRTLEIKDTTVMRGVELYIPVYGNLPSDAVKLDMTFTFDGILLDIRSVRGGEGFSINEENPWFSIDMSDLRNSKLHIVSESISYSPNSIICEIVLEALVGPDSVTTISPESIFIDGSPGSDFELRSGKITMGAPVVVPSLTEGFESIFPNPFDDYTTIVFSIERDTPLEFKIFSLSGRMVDRLPDSYNDVFDYQLVLPDGTIITDMSDRDFPAGRYKLVLNPKSWQFSAGAYVLILNTRSGSHQTNFINIK